MASLTLSVSSWIRTTELTDCTKTFTSSLCGTKCMCMCVDVCVYVCGCMCMCVDVCGCVCVCVHITMHQPDTQC